MNTLELKVNVSNEFNNITVFNLLRHLLTLSSSFKTKNTFHIFT